MKKLPDSLRLEVLKEINGNILKEKKIFQTNFSENFLKEIAPLVLNISILFIFFIKYLNINKFIILLVERDINRAWRDNFSLTSRNWKNILPLEGKCRILHKFRK